jgi:hypothetical protein
MNALPLHSRDAAPLTRCCSIDQTPLPTSSRSIDEMPPSTDCCSVGGLLVRRPGSVDNEELHIEDLLFVVCIKLHPLTICCRVADLVVHCLPEVVSIDGDEGFH